MLDRERADFDRLLAGLREASARVVAVQLPIGSDTSSRGPSTFSR